MINQATAIYSGIQVFFLGAEWVAIPKIAELSALDSPVKWAESEKIKHKQTKVTIVRNWHILFSQVIHDLHQECIHNIPIERSIDRSMMYTDINLSGNLTVSFINCECLCLEVRPIWVYALTPRHWTQKPLWASVIVHTATVNVYLLETTVN